MLLMVKKTLGVELVRSCIVMEKPIANYDPSNLNVYMAGRCHRNRLYMILNGQTIKLVYMKASHKAITKPEKIIHP